MNKNKGFTLIELLVVIAIIGLLSSVVFTSLNTARSKSRDVRRKADLNQLQTALNMFFDVKGYMPDNRKTQGQCQNDSDGYYTAIMQEIVNAGFLNQVPKDPGKNQYCYYNYGSEALIKGNLETESGVNPCSFGESGNWCTRLSDPTAWCLCVRF